MRCCHNISLYLLSQLCNTNEDHVGVSTLPGNEVFTLLWNKRFWWEGDTSGIEHHIITEYAFLCKTFTERPSAKEQLKMHYCCRPNVHLHKQNESSFLIYPRFNLQRWSKTHTIAKRYSDAIPLAKAAEIYYVYINVTATAQLLEQKNWPQITLYASSSAFTK